VSLPAQKLPDEIALQTAFTLNFCKFVQWPSDGSEGAFFDIGFVGPSDTAPQLQKLLQGKTIQGKPVRILALSPNNPAQDLPPVIFFANKEIPPSWHDFLEKSPPVLTVGNMEHFLAKGGIIQFIQQDGRIRFQINHPKAMESGLQISAHLLKLAIPGDPEEG